MPSSLSLSLSYSFLSTWPWPIAVLSPFHLFDSFTLIIPISPERLPSLPPSSLSLSATHSLRPVLSLCTRFPPLVKSLFMCVQQKWCHLFPELCQVIICGKSCQKKFSISCSAAGIAVSLIYSKSSILQNQAFKPKIASPVWVKHLWILQFYQILNHYLVCYRKYLTTFKHSDN